MLPLFIVVVAFHVLSGVFWAGSTFVVARNPQVWSRGIARAQFGAALVAVAAGAVLWGLLRLPIASPSALVLALGAACAILAAAIQLVLALTAGNSTVRPVLWQRAAAVLLAVTVVAMATARYAI
jgi:hypothetical protein